MEKPAQRETVIDTTVLVYVGRENIGYKKNAESEANATALIASIQDGNGVALISEKLVNEYASQIRAGMNDRVDAFLEIISRDSNRVRWNWHVISRAERGRLRSMKYPMEDLHLFATAKAEWRTYIATFEHRLAICTESVRREFNVVIGAP